MNIKELIERMRGFEIDHEPDGWPAIRMREVSALCEALLAQQVVIEQMRDALVAEYRFVKNNYGETCPAIAEALALQPDLSALREHDAAIREQCAKVCEETEVNQYTHAGTTYDDGAATLSTAAEHIRKGEFDDNSSGHKRKPC